MGHKLRGFMPAYRTGRLDEYLKLRFGGALGYYQYVFKRDEHRILSILRELNRLIAYPNHK